MAPCTWVIDIKVLLEDRPLDEAVMVTSASLGLLPKPCNGLLGWPIPQRGLVQAVGHEVVQVQLTESILEPLNYPSSHA